MTNEQIQKGREQLKLMAGEIGEAMVAKLEREAPALASIVLGFGFGEIYAREGLAIREKELLSIASLVTQGDTAGQLHFHFTAALNAGVTEAELIEALIHCIPHVGIPRVMNAFQALAGVTAGKQD